MGQTVTVSAYIKNPDAATTLELHYYDSDLSAYASVSSLNVPANSDWTRAEVTFTNSKSAALSVSIHLRVENPGTYYVDCVQMEWTETASRFNLVDNGDFSHSGVNSGSYGWVYSGFAGTDGPVYAATSPAPVLSTFAMQMTGSPTSVKQIYQDIPASGNTNDVYVLSGWAKGDSVPLKDDSRQFCLKAVFYNTDGTQTIRKVDFNPDNNTTNNWQYVAAPVIADKAYSSIRVMAVYGNNANTVLFDGIQLFKEQFGNSYTYNEEGKVISVEDLQKQTTTYEYNTNGDITKILQDNEGKVTYTYYPNSHNVETATTGEGIEYSFEYDTYGNNTKVTIGTGTSTISSSAEYTSDGNYLESTTDALAKVTNYGYNRNTGMLDWVQYPEDTEATRTNYTYDAMYRMAMAECTTNTGLNQSVGYTYEDDRLTAIQTPSSTYMFMYGEFGLRNQISVQDVVLAQYTYTDDANRYLQQLWYGNNDRIDYTYDNKGRLLTQTYEDGDTVSYAYDNNGALAKVTDSATGRTTTYYYDLTDRMMKYTETGTDFSHSVGYEYDSKNNVTQLVETINGTEHTTSYEYDDDNRITKLITGDSTVVYTYDTLGRAETKVTKDGSRVVLAESYTYTPRSATESSAQVATHSVIVGSNETLYTYTYDDNGNILSITKQNNTVNYDSDGNISRTEGDSSTTSYAYDSANQLTMEVNYTEKTGGEWFYDAAGNIISKYDYEYEEEYESFIPYEIEYEYGSQNWGDLLTKYDNKAITRDDLGNPLTYDGWTYTWERGRQLATAAKNGTTWTYIYNADGLRTSKANGTDTWSYVYNGSQLTQLSKGTDTLYFTYDANGTPLAVTYMGLPFYYETNLQGDVVGIRNYFGTSIVSYTYDAWGNILSTDGSAKASLGKLNPLRYRGYVYDEETELYYLQSRYYDPEMGRFINADAFTSTGQGLTGNNMFAYCGNNPVKHIDKTGTMFVGLLNGGLESTRYFLGGHASAPLPPNPPKVDQKEEVIDRLKDQVITSFNAIKAHRSDIAFTVSGVQFVSDLLVYSFNLASTPASYVVYGIGFILWAWEAWDRITA